MTDNQGYAADRDKTAERPDEKNRRQLADLHENVDFLIHEIRTPLTAIISSAELLMAQQDFPERQGAFLDIIQKEALRINDLLTSFHRSHQQESEAWLSRMTFSAIPVVELLHDAATRFRNASLRHTIQVRPVPKLPPVRGDRMKLDLVLRNLVANAIKYSPNGGAIILSARKNPDGVTVCVQDHGIGIPAENLTRIFDRNFRVDNPTSRQTRGSGQGLAIVTRIVEYHGGTLRVKSRPEKGSTFFFTLPQYT